MAFNKNKKIVTTALTAAMVASAVAPVAAAKLTPAQDATKAVDAYYKLSVKTRADVSNSAKVKKVALAKIAKLGKKDAKVKASLTAKVAKKSAAINKYYQTVIVAAEKEAAAIKAVEAALKLASETPITAETTKEQVEAAYASVIKLIDAVKTEAKKTEFKAAADKMKADALKKIEELAAPVVTGVTAINAKEVKITFNKDLSKSSAETAANYSVAVNGGAFATVTGNPSLQSDKRSVIVPLNAALVNGQSFKVKASGVRTVNLDDVKSYTSEAMVFSDSTKATVTYAGVSGTTLELSFSEPVASGAKTEVYIDGVKVGTTLTDVSTVGSYDYNVTLTAAQAAEYSKVGAHKVDVYYVNDAASNETVFTSVNYTVGTDTEAPFVKEVKALGQNTFKVYTNEAFAGFAVSNLTVKKGNYTFDSADLSVGAYSASEKSYTVTVDTNAADVNNPLYAAGESSVSLSVEINGIKDAAGYVGNKFQGTVALSKDTVAPKVVDNRLNYADTAAADLFVKFDEKVVIADATKVTLRDKDGVKVTQSTDATAVQGKGEAGTTQYVKVDLAALNSSEYTVEFAPGAIKDAFNNTNSATISTTVSVAPSASGVSLPLVYGTDVTVANNVITINFGQEMDDSAKVLSNYKFNDSAFPTGTTINWGTDKKTVEIVLPTNTFAKDTTGLVTVTSGVKTKLGKNVFENAASGKENVVKLGATDVKDNIAPTLTKAAYVVVNSTDVTSTKLRLSFSEAVAVSTGAESDFAVVVNGKKINVSSVSDVNAGDNWIELTLAETINVTQAATVTVVKDSTNADGIQVVDLGSLANKLAAGSTTATTKEQ